MQLIGDCVPGDGKAGIFTFVFFVALLTIVLRRRFGLRDHVACQLVRHDRPGLFRRFDFALEVLVFLGLPALLGVLDMFSLWICFVSCLEFAS